MNLTVDQEPCTKAHLTSEDGGERVDAPAFDVYRDTAGPCVSCTPYSCHRDNVAGDSRLTGPEDRTMSDSYEFAPHREPSLRPDRSRARWRASPSGRRACTCVERRGLPVDGAGGPRTRNHRADRWSAALEPVCASFVCHRARSAVQHSRLLARFLQAPVEDGDPTLMFVLQTCH